MNEQFDLGHTVGRIEQKVDVALEEIRFLRSDFSALKSEQDQKKGQAAGVKFLLTILKTMPISVTSFLIGKGWVY